MSPRLGMVTIGYTYMWPVVEHASQRGCEVCVAKENASWDDAISNPKLVVPCSVELKFVGMVCFRPEKLPMAAALAAQMNIDRFVSVDAALACRSRERSTRLLQAAGIPVADEDGHPEQIVWLAVGECPRPLAIVAGDDVLECSLSTSEQSHAIEIGQGAVTTLGLRHTNAFVHLSTTSDGSMVRKVTTWPEELSLLSLLTSETSYDPVMVACQIALGEEPSAVQRSGQLA